MNATERKNAIGDIYYEAQMLNRAYTEYWRPRLRMKEVWIHNSILEATLVHVRALADFFEHSRNDLRPPHADDVLAEDYGFPVTTFTFPASVRIHINKRIAHLSYERTRIDPSKKHWDLASFIPPLIAQARDFFLFLRSTNHPLPSSLTGAVLESFLNDNADKVA